MKKTLKKIKRTVMLIFKRSYKPIEKIDFMTLYLKSIMQLQDLREHNQQLIKENKNLKNASSEYLTERKAFAFLEAFYDNAFHTCEYCNHKFNTFIEFENHLPCSNKKRKS